MMHVNGLMFFLCDDQKENDVTCVCSFVTKKKITSLFRFFSSYTSSCEDTCHYYDYSLIAGQARLFFLPCHQINTRKGVIVNGWHMTIIYQVGKRSFAFLGVVIFFGGGI